MDDIIVARAAHILAIVVWIGGVAFVTLVLLPALREMDGSDRLSMFERLERRFAGLAKISVIVAGASGLHMTHAMAAWDRFSDVQFWWMHAMLAVWLIFAIVLFIAEPLFLHAWFHRYAEKYPDASFDALWRMHCVLLTLSLVTTAAAVLGAHGGLQ